MPSFITANGPMREARFHRNPDGTPDGGVHDLFTITGRTDAPGCKLALPNFAQAVADHNVIVRIPAPTFGLGLVEATSDSTLRANLAANRSAKVALRIRGSLNASKNDGTITRFGWKAQNKSLLIFAGEAYNVGDGRLQRSVSQSAVRCAGCSCQEIRTDHPQTIAPRLVSTEHQSCRLDGPLDNRYLALV